MLWGLVIRILLPAAVLARIHQIRSHGPIAKLLKSKAMSLGDGQFQNVQLTWYSTDTGPDACTGKNHLDSDYVGSAFLLCAGTVLKHEHFVAMASAAFAGSSGCCSKQISITANNRTAIATCVDECPSCDGENDLDLTKGLFEFFSGGDLSVGVLSASWLYIDGNGRPQPPQTTTVSPSGQTPANTASTTSTSDPTGDGEDCDDEDDPSAVDDETPANTTMITSDDDCDDEGHADEKMIPTGKTKRAAMETTRAQMKEREINWIYVERLLHILATILYYSISASNFFLG
ncbi:hypothetical protein B0H14DRAFT_3859236 [Mycena olivaceomarginata]|nr:hypothetical protein B0H14DRAFT_3859236 [Mycena olivaceomarginata]